MSETRDLVSGLNPLDQWARQSPPTLPQPNVPPPAQPAAPADPAAEVANFYSKEFNLPPFVGAGIAKYMQTRESGLRPDAYNPDDRGSPSAGIAQWHGPRLAALQQTPGAETLQGQLQFSAQELRGPENRTLEALKHAKTEQEAFDIWKTSYERPAELHQGLDWANEDRSRYQGEHNSATELMRDLLKQIDKEPPGSEQRRVLLAQAQEASQRASDSFEALRKTPPVYKPLDAMENFGSAATMIAILGGLFAKRPMIASLAAGGVAMQAQQQQNWDQFKVASDQWYHQAQLGIEQSRMAHDQIREVMDDERLAENERHGRLTELMSAWQMSQQFQNADRSYQLQEMSALALNTDRAEEAALRRRTSDLYTNLEAARKTGDPDRIKEAEQAVEDWNKAQGKGISVASQPQRLALEKFLQENPNASAQEIQQFLQTGRGARSGLALATQKYIQENPNATAQDIAKFYAGMQAEVAGTRAVTTGKAGDTIRAFSVSISHLDVLQDAANALKNGDIQRFNAGKNRLKSEFGDPDPANFEAVRTIVGSEVNKAIQGGVGALTDREELRSAFSLASSPAQLDGVIFQLKRLMAGQLEGYRRQYQDILTPEEFDRKLSPAAQKELGALAPSGGGGAATYASPDDIYKAFDAGSLTKEQAKQLLIDKFGYKP